MNHSNEEEDKENVEEFEEEVKNPSKAEILSALGLIRKWLEVNKLEFSVFNDLEAIIINAICDNLKQRKILII